MGTPTVIAPLIAYEKGLTGRSWIPLTVSNINLDLLDLSIHYGLLLHKQSVTSTHTGRVTFFPLLVKSKLDHSN